MIFLIVFSVILFALFVVFAIIGLHIDQKRYIAFISENSLCFRSLKKINSEFTFFPEINYDQSHTYDNENFYETISCEDFLIYQLQYYGKKVSEQIEKINRNVSEYRKYIEQIKTLQLGKFSAPIGKLKAKKLLKTEKRLFHKTKIPPPATQFFLTVTLYCSNINGRTYDSKRETYSAEAILKLIKRLQNRNGAYYRDREIWDAICRVERGKVSNKMRFSIYARDGYRCRKCGVSQRYATLEIDHIIPIAKGGKSTYDNLQTLCHKCNVEKGDKL